MNQKPKKLEPLKPVRFPSESSKGSSKGSQSVRELSAKPPKSTRQTIAEMRRLSKKGMYVTE